MIPILTVMKACLSFGTEFYSVSMVMKKIEDKGEKPIRTQIRHKLWKLEAEGLLTRIKSKKYPKPTWKKGRPVFEIYYRNTKALEKRASSQPSLRNKPACQTNNAWDKMWKAARMLRKFTRNDMVTICGVTLSNAQYFTKAYTTAGYLRKLLNTGREGVWMITKDPGPNRPYYKGE